MPETITVDEDFFYDLLMLMHVQKDIHAMDASGMIDEHKVALSGVIGYPRDQQKIINQSREIGFELWRRNKESRLGSDWWKQEPKIEISKSLLKPELAGYRMPSQLKEK